MSFALFLSSGNSGHMNLRQMIINAENEYLSLLEEFFIRKWGNAKLWSHDLNHHRRVWNYSKQLLKIIDREALAESFIRKLLIASYLHDLGMSTDPGVKHGYNSRKSAEEFLNNNFPETSDYQDVLFAIENHDNKEYGNESVQNMLLKILSIADDLDAFGKTGIERYLEIYHVRGIPETDIARTILENAASRFSNFELFASGKHEFYMKHKRRYLLLRDYFEGLKVKKTP